MAVPRFLYSHPLDNFLRTATSLSVTAGVLESGYDDLAALYDGVPGSPVKATGVALTIEGEWAAPVAPGLAALIHTNLDVAAQLQGNFEAVWGAPAVDLAFGVPVMNARGIFSGPRLELDVEAQAFWRLVIAGNWANVVLGEFYLGRRRELDGFVVPGARGALRGQSVRNRTYMGVPLSYELAPGLEEFAGGLIVEDADQAAAKDLVHAARFGARPFVCVPRSDRDDAWMVTIPSDALAVTPLGPATDQIELPLEQVSFGVSWPDPDDLDS